MGFPSKVDLPVLMLDIGGEEPSISFYLPAELSNYLFLLFRLFRIGSMLVGIDGLEPSTPTL